MINSINFIDSIFINKYNFLIFIFAFMVTQGAYSEVLTNGRIANTILTVNGYAEASSSRRTPTDPKYPSIRWRVRVAIDRLHVL